MAVVSEARLWAVAAVVHAACCFFFCAEFAALPNRIADAAVGIAFSFAADTEGILPRVVFGSTRPSTDDGGAAAAADEDLGTDDRG